MLTRIEHLLFGMSITQYKSIAPLEVKQVARFIEGQEDLPNTLNLVMNELSWNRGYIGYDDLGIYYQDTIATYHIPWNIFCAWCEGMYCI